MGINLISNDLKQYISKKLNKEVQQLQEEDLLEIKRLTLKLKNIFDEETDYNIKDLKNFQNLVDCTIFLFPITDEEMRIINELQKLEYISLDNCEIKTNKLEFSKNIKNLFMNNCKYQEQEIFSISGQGLKNIEIIGNHENMRTIDISNFNTLDSLENLDIHYYNVLGLEKITKLAPNLKKLNLDGSIIENAESHFTNLKEKIEISNEKYYFLN